MPQLKHRQQRTLQPARHLLLADVLPEVVANVPSIYCVYACFSDGIIAMSKYDDYIYILMVCVRRASVCLVVPRHTPLNTLSG